MSEKKCHLCSAFVSGEGYDTEDFEYLSPGAYEYNTCVKCGLLEISPHPSPEVLKLAYPSHYHAYHEHHNFLAQWFKQIHWKKKAVRYSKLVDHQDRIVDLGCAYGDLIHEFTKMGFKNVSGVEFNEKVFKKAIKRGLNVLHGSVEKLGADSESIDMIIMENFIEHVDSPLDTMRQCHNYLKPGGLIAGETPNIDSWDYKIGKRFWGGYHAPRHIYLFNIFNIQLLADKAGFEIVSIKNTIQPAHWALTVQNYLKNVFPDFTLIRGRSHFFLPLLLIFLPVNIIQTVFSKTSLIEFVFKKKPKEMY